MNYKMKAIMNRMLSVLLLCCFCKSIFLSDQTEESLPRLRPLLERRYKNNKTSAVGMSVLNRAEDFSNFLNDLNGNQYWSISDCRKLQEKAVYLTYEGCMRCIDALPDGNKELVWINIIKQFCIAEETKTEMDNFLKYSR